MGTRKKNVRNAKKPPSGGSRDKAPREREVDLSKYKDAVSDKSKGNLATLKLAARRKQQQAASADPVEKPRAKSDKKSWVDDFNDTVMKGFSHGKPAERAPDGTVAAPDGKSAAPAEPDRKASPSGTKTRKPTRVKDGKSADSGKEKKKNRRTKKDSSKAAVSADQANREAEERYSKALDNESHYSSAVEKFYMKYPDADNRKSHPSGSSDGRRPKRRRTVRRGGKSVAGGKGPAGGKSVAELAASGKKSPSARQHAEIAGNARVRGVVTSRVANKAISKRRKRKNPSFNLLVIFCLLAFLAALSVTVFFNVKGVVVKGESRYSEEQILSICKFRKGDNILFIDTEKTEESIVSDLPYIAECKLKRRLPSTVVIEITEAVPLGVAVRADGGWSVISTDGKLLETVNPDEADSDKAPDEEELERRRERMLAAAQAMKLPLLEGIDLGNTATGDTLGEEAMAIVKDYVTISEAASAYKLKLSAIRTGKRGYEAEYDGRLRIIVGDTADEQTVKKYMKAFRHILSINGVNDEDSGEISFFGNEISFIPDFEISEEDMNEILQQRWETKVKSLLKMGGFFMDAGNNWKGGRLETK